MRIYYLHPNLGSNAGPYVLSSNGEDVRYRYERMDASPNKTTSVRVIEFFPYLISAGIYQHILCDGVTDVTHGPLPLSLSNSDSSEDCI